MTERAGDFDYETHGTGYAVRRRTDPAIAAYVHAGLGSARTVLNVGAGAGSYEPEDRHVVAVEPSAAMRAQRGRHLAPAIDARAEELPFDDDAFDAAMATVTVHQWSDSMRGLREMRRVTRGPVVVLTFDGTALDRFWLAEYAPELMVAERRRYPLIESICDALGDSRRADHRDADTARLRRRLHRGVLRPTRGVPGVGRPAFAIGVGIRRARRRGARRSPTARRPGLGRVGCALRRAAHAASLRRIATTRRRARRAGRGRRSQSLTRTKSFLNATSSTRTPSSHCPACTTAHRCPRADRRRR